MHLCLFYKSRCMDNHNLSQVSLFWLFHAGKLDVKRNFTHASCQGLSWWHTWNWNRLFLDSSSNQESSISTANTTRDPLKGIHPLTIQFISGKGKLGRNVTGLHRSISYNQQTVVPVIKYVQYCSIQQTCFYNLMHNYSRRMNWWILQKQTSNSLQLWS